MRGPYKLSELLEKLTCVEKNQTYTLTEFAEKVNLDRHTVARLAWLYTDVVNTAFAAAGLPHRLKAVNYKVTKGIRLEGCEYGPFGVVRWPVLPRFLEWVKERPKLVEWLLDHPEL